MAAAFVLSGCASEVLSEYFDPTAELTRDDFKQGMAAQEPVAPPPPPPIPDLQPVITAPTLGSEIRSRRVTVTVTETTPLKDVLIELAREARIGLELDPRIEGGVIFSAYDRPFEQVLKRLSDLAGLRYKFNDGVMRIELDDPYHTNYKLGYLSLVRTATSQIGTSSTVVGGNTAGGGSSTSSVSGSSKADFWAELETNITQILTNTATRTGLVAALVSEPGIIGSVTPSAPTEAAPAAPVTTSSGLESLNALIAQAQGVSAAGAPAPLTPTTPTVTPQTAAGTLATPVAATAAGASIPTLTPAFAAASSLYTINRQAGILSVYGTERQHREIEAYLRGLRKSIGAQVLIEAKILEVSLDDEFRFGINWATLGAGIFNAAAPFNTATTTAVAAPPFSQLIGGEVGGNTATANVFTLGIDTSSFDVIANAVEQFGTVRALSSPRLTVMQNQTAVLKVAEEQVFFDVTIVQSTETTGDNSPIQTTATSEINTVTVGLVMTVQPSINLDTEEITLTLRPTITSVVRTRNDPAVDFQVAQIVPAPPVAITSQIPEISVQEIDSVITVQSGHVIVMGGLMQDRSTVNEFSIPGLGDLPWVGRAFRSTDRTTKKFELVIFLRATIIRNAKIDAYDIRLYDQFGQDRRPLVF